LERVFFVWGFVCYKYNAALQRWWIDWGFVCYKYIAALQRVRVVVANHRQIYSRKGIQLGSMEISQNTFEAVSK
jgi:hypothetical protein